MPIKARENKFGAYAFLLGVIIAVVAGILGRQNTGPLIFLILALIGIIASFFVPHKDVQTFLIAAVSLVIVSFAGIQGIVLDAGIRGVSVGFIEVGRLISSILSALIVLFVPATIVVALKSVFSISA